MSPLVFSTRPFRLFLIAVACITLSALALRSYAYSVRVLVEGFPAPVWPAKGSFELVAGGNAPIKRLETMHLAGDWSQELIEKSHGTALVVARDGAVALERFSEGFDASTRFNSYSMVKSLVGILILKAEAEGEIESLDDPIGRYLTDFADPYIRRVTIRAFLEMRSGLDFEQDEKVLVPGGDPKEKQTAHYNPFGLMAKLHVEGLNAVAGGLALGGARNSVRGKPEFRYQNINTAILGHLLEVVYGRSLAVLLSEKIWRPSGAGDAYWRRYGDGLPVSGYCCLYATADDWIKVGALLVNNGTGQVPFLPDKQYAALFGRDVKDDQRNKGVYGLHVRHDILNRAGEPLQGRFTYFLGNGGQTLYLMPDKRLVVVRFGSGLQLLHSTLYSVWRDIRGQ